MKLIRGTKGESDGGALSTVSKFILMGLVVVILILYSSKLVGDDGINSKIHGFGSQQDEFLCNLDSSSKCENNTSQNQNNDLNIEDLNVENLNENELNSDLKITISKLKLILIENTNAYDYVFIKSKEYGLDPLITLTVINMESHGDFEAISPAYDGNKHSVGLMQLSEDTAKSYGLSISFPDERKDPKKNLDVGIKYLALLVNKYNFPDAYVVYNGGNGALGESKDCPGLKVYECEWDDRDHTKPNKGYIETRKAIVLVKNTYDNLQNSLIS